MNPGVYLQDFRLGFKNQVTAGWPGRQAGHKHTQTFVGGNNIKRWKKAT